MVDNLHISMMWGLFFSGRWSFYVLSARTSLTIFSATTSLTLNTIYLSS